MSPRRQPVQPDETVHHESVRRKRRGAGSAGMSLNLTPMIDVTFQLLLFFIITTNFTREGLIQSSLPETAGTPPPVVPLRLTVREETPEQVTVDIDTNPRQLGLARLDASEKVEVIVDVGGQQVTLADFLAGVKKSGQFSDRSPVFIKPDTSVASGPSWQYVLGVYNSVVKAGFSTICWD